MTYKIIPYDPDLVAGWNMVQGPAGTVQDVGSGGYAVDLFGSHIQRKSGVDFDGVTGYGKNSALDNWPNGKGAMTLLAVLDYTNADVSPDRIAVGWYFIELTSIKTTNGYIQFAVRAASTQTVQSDVMWNDGKKHFVMGTYDSAAGSNNVNLFIDGVKQTVPKSNTGNMVSTSKFNIAARNDASSSTYCFDGTIHNAAIYNKAKSQAWYEQEFNRFKLSL